MNTITFKRLTSLWIMFALLGLGATQAQAGIVAYEVPENTDGNQQYDGVLGMDFIVNTTIAITHLGVFDDDSDGLLLDITGELWSRDDNGTANDPNDDSSGLKLLSHVFTGTNETLLGGSRYLELAEALILGPGAYSIVAHGYGAEENGNARAVGGGGNDPAWTTNDGGGLLSFVGCGRFGGSTGNTIGDTVDTVAGCGPENRYAAGTFQYTEVPAPGGLGLMLFAGALFLMRRLTNR